MRKEAERARRSEGLPDAMRTSVVPVSTIPAVDDKMLAPPYVMLWSTPKYKLAGEVAVSGTACNAPLNLDASAPPSVSSPFTAPAVFVGSNDIPTCLFGMRPRVKAVSITVGTRFPLEVVPVCCRISKRRGDGVGGVGCTLGEVCGPDSVGGLSGR